MPWIATKDTKHMDANILATTLSTLAQVSATLAALMGFLGLWKLDWLGRAGEREQENIRQLVAYRPDLSRFLTSLQPMEEVMNYAWHRLERIARDMVATQQEASIPGVNVVFNPRGPLLEAALARVCALPNEAWWLKRGLGGFVLTALVVLGAALLALIHTPNLHESAWLPRAIVVASLILAIGTAYMVAEVGGWIRQDRTRLLTGIGISIGILVVWMVCGCFIVVIRGADVPQIDLG
jgi:hypothetical protein